MHGLGMQTVLYALEMCCLRLPHHRWRNTYQTIMRVSLSSMDVETTNPIHHLICGGGIVRGCTVLCVIDMYGHRWDTDKQSCFLYSEQHVHAVGDDAHLQFYPTLLA